MRSNVFVPTSSRINRTFNRNLVRWYHNMVYWGWVERNELSKEKGDSDKTVGTDLPIHPPLHTEKGSSRCGSRGNWELTPLKLHIQDVTDGLREVTFLRGQ